MSDKELTIKAPNFKTAVFHIRGTAPYVQHKFSEKARKQIKDTQEAGSTVKSKRKRGPKDFKAAYEGCLHRADGDWFGIPASAFRNGMISACRLVGFKMTHAKLSVFVEADGFDSEGYPLVKIIKGEPEVHESYVRLAGMSAGPDIRVRPMWKEWEAKLRIRWDGDQFTMEDVANLLERVGQQVGVGEGRPDSPKSCGMGWGLFTIANKTEREAV